MKQPIKAAHDIQELSGRGLELLLAKESAEIVAYFQDGELLCASTTSPLSLDGPAGLMEESTRTLILEGAA